jgi:hypothetical protein
MHGRRDPPHSVTAATRRIRHALALAVFASMSAGISVAQGAPQGLTPASQLARHYQHEDALYQLSERAASFPTPQGLRADGLRYQRMAQVYKGMESAPVSGGGSSFSWNDWAIGIGTGIGLALLLGAGLLVGRHQRHRVQPA